MMWYTELSSLIQQIGTTNTPLDSFMYALKSSESRRQYPRRLKLFFDFIGLSGTLSEQAVEFLKRSKADINSMQDNVIRFLDFHKERVRRKELAAGTVKNYYRAFKLFCEMNDLSLNWKKISRGLPRVKKSSSDRAPTLEELRKMMEYPDRRIKSIVCSMTSGGFRLGAWDYLRWKHVIPVSNNKGDVIAAKVIIYAEEEDEYYTFITPEAYCALKDWMDFRNSYGEKITGDSWLMRDLWQTTNQNYGARWGLATNPKKLQSIAIKRLLSRVLWEQGIRQALSPGVKRHEWKGTHGYRKAFKSRAEQVMRPANVEILMGHDIGISESYWRPTEHELLEDYLKAVPLLTIISNSIVLEKQIEELTEKSKEENYIIEGRLSEKDREIAGLKEKYDADIASLKDEMRFMRELLDSTISR
jgi:integrase